MTDLQKKLEVAEYIRQTNYSGVARIAAEYGFLSGMNRCLELLQQGKANNSFSCHHNYIQKDSYWKSCTYCGMLAPLSV